ncbi:flagellar basal body P-ring formation chaperone FlgA [Sphingomonas sp. 1P06PA]|uniref:flagellar basal body P-ring formation chaperone FlgA n=1 Tax=Sphingomonas sp. 1P06PA TaxID=554121 RepID=UPI0039A74DB0
MIRLSAPALLLAAVPAAATPFQDLDAIEVQVTAALGAGIGEPGGPAAPIDRRLKLAACPQPLSVEPPAMGAVAVRCAAIGWRIRVPLVRQEVAAPAEIVRQVPVVRRGEQVEITARARGFSVSTQGTAQADGAPGERIRVKTDGKTPIILAEVVGPGEVRVAALN